MKIPHSQSFENSRDWICRTLIRKTRSVRLLFLLPGGEGQDEGELQKLTFRFSHRSLNSCHGRHRTRPPASQKNVGGKNLSGAGCATGVSPATNFADSIRPALAIWISFARGRNWMLNWTAVSIVVPISGGMMGSGKSICNRAELKRCDFGIPIYGKTRNAFVTRFSMNYGHARRIHCRNTQDR